MGYATWVSIYLIRLRAVFYPWFFQVAPSDPSPKKQKIVDLKSVMDGLNRKEAINDDFVAAFLQAGIPVSKFDHPSIRGLVRKYTQVLFFFSLFVV